MQEITGKDIHYACLNGAKQVMNNRQILNKINVFPVQDGDTGSNLASMMGTIVRDSRSYDTVSETFESISDAALRGARGNSGIIFAQYLSGLTIEVGDVAVLSPSHYAVASEKAVRYAYEAIEEPVEGTIITVMKAWGQSLVELMGKGMDTLQAMSLSYENLEEALVETQFQLKDLKKAGVVDSGAKGFVFFVKGMLDYFLHGGDDSITTGEAIDDPELEIPHNHNGELTYRYCTEGLLEGDNISSRAIKEALVGLGDSAVVAANGKRCRIHIHTDRPDKVFEVLHEFGTSVFQKAEDMKMQQDVVTHRKSDIALVTDSIADVPQSFIDDHQIHIVNINLLFREMSFIDRLTIRPAQILELSKDDRKLPTSSQPDPKQVENLYNYLSTYYQSAIILPVSSQLSGTYNVLNKTAQSFADKGFRISIIDTKQNSGAQGLLVVKAAMLIEEGKSHEEIVESVNASIPLSKILVRVKTLDNMVKSGRLSTNAGKIGKVIGLKPIVTLDEEGKGALDGIAFSVKGSLKKLVAHMKKVMRTHDIESYNLVHVNNPEEAEVFADMFTKKLGQPPAYINETSSVVAVGAGQGAVALSYILKPKAVR